MNCRRLLLSSICEAPAPIKKFLGRGNFYILLSGFFPNHNAFCPTGSFKDYITSLTLRFKSGKELVVASAGNVARAFFYKASALKRKITIVLPSYALDDLLIPIKPFANIKIFSVSGSYNDAITFAKNLVEKFPNKYQAEGGIKNRWRILGLFRLFRRLPKIDIYFQAVSGGVGPLSMFETSKLLKKTPPKLFISQNLPYAPVLSAIKGEKVNPDSAKNILAKVLSNAQTDVNLIIELLNQTKGRIYGVTNEQLMEAKDILESWLGQEVDPSAAVALASAKLAISSKDVSYKENFLIHVTGGGYELIKKFSPLKEQIEKVR